MLIYNDDLTSIVNFYSTMDGYILWVWGIPMVQCIEHYTVGSNLTYICVCGISFLWQVILQPYIHFATWHSLFLSGNVLWHLMFIYIFQAMVMFAGVRHFKSTLFSSLHSLCSDFHYSVRKTVASGFHEVAKLLTSHASILIPEFITLLQDDSTEVGVVL